MPQEYTGYGASFSRSGTVSAGQHGRTGGNSAGHSESFIAESHMGICLYLRFLRRFATRMITTRDA